MQRFQRLVRQVVSDVKASVNEVDKVFVLGDFCRIKVRGLFFNRIQCLLYHLRGHEVGGIETSPLSELPGQTYCATEIVEASRRGLDDRGWKL